MKITVGVDLHVPAGADLLRSRPYYARIIEVYVDKIDQDITYVRLVRVRADGTLGCRRGQPRRPFSALLDRTKLRERQA